MAGKCRPSLREKTLEIVKHSNLSQTNKDCIAEVFKRYEEAQVTIERLNVYANDLLGLLVGRKTKQDESETLEDIQARDEVDANDR